MTQFKLVHNVETGKITEVKLTPAEIAQNEKDAQESANLKAQSEARAAAKLVAQAKLAALGLTVEDLTALGL